MPQDPPKQLWRNVSFTLMWTSTAASGFGDRMMMLAALALLGGLTGTADSTSLQAATQFWFFVPYLVFSLIGGFLSDKLPRKWVMLACDELRGMILLWAFFALAAASTSMTVLPQDRWWEVYAVLGATGACAAIFNPARTAIVPQIVTRDQLQPANAVVLVINVVFSMIGMVVGGIIIDPDSPTTVRTGLLIGALFYVISGTFFAFMKPRTTGLGIGGSTGKRQAIGPIQLVTYVATHRRLVTLILAEVFVWGVAAVVASSIIGLVKIRYQIEDAQLMFVYTLVSATLGVGMLLGAALVMLVRTRQESTLVITLALLGAGAATTAFVAAPYLWMTFATALLVGVCGNVAIITLTSMIQSITPDYIRGSVLGLSALLTTVASVAVYLAIWKLPNADVNIITLLWYLGPALFVFAAVMMVLYLRTGPFITAVNWPMHFVRLYMYSYHRLRYEGKQHVPTTGRAIIAPNHVTGIDGLCVQSPLQRMIRWLMIEEYKFPLLNFIWKGIQPIALQRDAPPSKQVRQIVKVLKEDELVTIFPEGTLQRTDRRVRPFQQGVVAIAKLAKAPIVPAWIHGGPMFHHMIWHALVPSRSRIVFGPALVLDRNMSVQDANAELRRRIMALGRYVHFDEAGYQCPQCDTDLNETYAGGDNACPNCGHVIFDTTPGQFEEGTFGVNPNAEKSGDSISD